MTPTKPYRIGIALSGGGARGIAHIGILQALAEAGIQPDVISGTSAGAIVGAMYANGCSTEQMLDTVRESSIFGLFKLGWPTGGLTRLTYLKDRLATVINEDDFKVLKSPLFITVTNMSKGEAEYISEGKLFDAITASASIPIIFQPVEINGSIYVDGGLLNNMPVECLYDQCDFVIASNVTPKVDAPNKLLNSTMGLATRVFTLAVISNTRPSLQLADFVFAPHEVSPYHIFQFNQFQILYEIGYKYGVAHVPRLIEALQAAGLGDAILPEKDRPGLSGI